MAQVPYTPYPTVSPRAPGVPAVSVSTTPDMFGANIGRGMEQLGATESHVGDELFQRAVAMQELRNETEAKQADANYMIESGKLHAQFSSLEGKNAVDAFPKYISDLKSLREDMRQGLSNDQARRYYDSSSLQNMGRSIFNGAGHAAVQQKAYANGTLDAQVKAYSSSALQNAKDEGAFQAGLQNIDEVTDTKAQLFGWGDAQKAEYKAERVSNLWANRIEGLSRTDPQAAKEMLSQHRQDIVGDHLARTDAIVRQQLYNTGARNISHDITTGRGNFYGAGPVSIERAKDAISHIESGGDYDAITDSKTALGRALGKYQVMEGELAGQLKDAGLPSMSPEEFLKNHSAQEQLFSVEFGKLMNKYGNFNDAASVWFSGKPAAEAAGRRDALGTTVPKYLATVNARLATTASLEEKTDLARSRADRIAPDDPLFGDYAVQRVETDHAHQKGIERDTRQTALQTVDEGLLGGPNGKVPTTFEELTADPKVAAALDKLEPSDKLKVQGKLRLIQNALRRQNNDEREKTLLGMAATSPEEFLDVDITHDSALNIGAMKTLLAKQREIRSKPLEMDPQVGRALAAMKDELGPNGVNLNRKDDPERYDKFVGSLQDALIEEVKKNNGRPLDIAQYRAVGARLLQTSVPAGWFSSEVKFYEQNIPSEDVEKWRQDWLSRHPDEPAPSDEDLRREFVRGIYQSLYNKPKPK